MAHIVIVMGGPGAGKSSICRALCAQRVSALHIEVDAIREAMISGFRPPDPIRDPHGDWVEQFALARRCVEFMAKVYADAGVDVVIDDTNIPAGFRAHYGSLYSDARTTPVFVYPGQAEQVRRMTLRNGPFDAMLIPAVAGPGFTQMQEGVDTTGWVDLRDPHGTVEEHVAAILAVMRGNAAAGR